MGFEKNIPEGWKVTGLESCLSSLIDYRGKTPKKSKTGILALSAKSVKMGYIDYSQAYFISPETYKKFMVRGFPKKGDILMTTEAPLGCIAKLDRENITVAQRLLTLRGKTNLLDNDYLMFYLMSRTGQYELKSRASGSTVQGIKRTEFSHVKIILPPLPEQKAIAKILTAFNDKIELLQAQNKTLETMAQTIFKEWFGKYQIGNELPEGWKVRKLGDISTHLKKNIKPFDNPEKRYCHYSLPAYDNGLKPITESGSEIKSNKYSVEKNTFLVSKLNPFTPRIWTIFDSDDSNICSTEFQVVKPNEASFFSITHCLLNSKYFTDNLSQKVKGTSSSHQRVNPEDIFEVDLIIPNKQELIRFERIVLPLITKKDINHNNIQSLTKTRDTLLPKLMSGQVRVKNIKHTADA